MKNLALGLFLILLALTVWAQPEAEDGVVPREARERERILQSRTSARAKFATDEARCYARFAVNDCLADVRSRRREVLADLRRQEILINDAQRKRRGAEQLLRSDQSSSRTP